MDKFFLGDKVKVNKYTVKPHVPPIDIDDEIHTIVNFERYEGEKFYVLNEYEENFFTDVELVLVERLDG